MWKDPINGRKFFNYTFENDVVKPADSQEMVLNCYDKMKQYVQKINFKNGTTVFTRQDLLDIPDFERTQIDRTKDEHLNRGGIFKPFKDGKGKTIRGKSDLGVVPYSFRPSYSKRAHQIYKLSNTEVAAFMGHSVPVHNSTYAQWSTESMLESSMERAIKFRNSTKFN